MSANKPWHTIFQISAT